MFFLALHIEACVGVRWVQRQMSLVTKLRPLGRTLFCSKQAFFKRKGYQPEDLGLKSVTIRRSDDTSLVGYKIWEGEEGVHELVEEDFTTLMFGTNLNDGSRAFLQEQAKKLYEKRTGLVRAMNMNVPSWTDLSLVE